MVDTILNIKKWGNSLGMRLPSVVAKAANLHLDQQVRLIVEDDKLVIIPEPEKEISLEQRLAKYDPQKHSAEVMTTEEYIGAEKL